MIFKPAQTHIIPTIMLLAAAALPVQPLATNSAYSDTEHSMGNVMQASATWAPRTTEPVVLVEPFALTALPGEVLAEIVEEPTEETPAEEPLPEVEVSDEPVEVVEEKPIEVETSEEPLEIDEPGESTPTDTEPQEVEPQPEVI